MGKKRNVKNCALTAVFLLLVAVCTLNLFATGTYDGGDGSQGNPFQINTPVQMNEIGQHPEDWGSYFILTADIDLASYTGTDFHIIGNSTTWFTGSFDGASHVISNFTYTSTWTDDVGLFSRVSNGGEIKNLRMVNVNVNAGGGYGTGSYVGGLVGYLWNSTVSNCQVAGSVRGDYFIGGLVGYSESGTISNCSVSGDVTGLGHNVGGLVGSNDWGSVSSCYAESSVSGYTVAGGLLGRMRAATVSNCYASGNVTGSIGQNGGLVGYSNSGTISNCYATGSVTGGFYVGGFIGGITCGNYPPYLNIFASFWDTQTSGQVSGIGYHNSACGGTVEVFGRTTAEMQTESTFTDYGWDFVGETANGTNDIWVMFGDGLDYPRLTWESKPPSCLVGWWPGDGHANDIEGENHGTLMNGATFATGKVGQAFSLDGVDDYVQIPYDGSFNLSSFTLQTWIKFTQNTYARIISRPSGGNADGFSFFNLSNAYGKIGGGVQGENGPNISISSAGSMFNDSTWHLCTFVHDIGANRISIYVDGVSNWSYLNSSLGGMEHNPLGIYIGSYDGSKWFFEGLIDEVAIYNCALDADEIWDIFLASVGEDYTPTGSGVVVQPVDPGTGTQPVTVTFNQVTEAGMTSLTTSSSGPTPPSGFELAGEYYDVTSTASYSPPVTVCIQYDDSGMTQEQEDELKLYHFESSGWVPVVPCSVNTLNNTVCGSVNSFSLFAIFQDVAPPEIHSISANPNVLRPANHKMVKVTVAVIAADNCDTAPASRIIAVSSNEPDNGLGDGDKAPDWEITGDLTVNLRAERSGTGNGRVYTLTVECKDSSGNSSTRNVEVLVPHNNKKKK